MQPERFFLIISNMRCGSTLTQFMLGELTDVSTDYEIKWKPGYAPHAIHLVIDEKTRSLKKHMQESIKSNRIVGSKLVFDPVALPSAEYDQIIELIDTDIDIIHIKRPYWEVVASSLRGFIHLPAQGADASQSEAYKILLDNKEQSMSKASYTLRRSHIKTSDVVALLKILLAADRCALRLRNRNHYKRVAYNRLVSRLLPMVRHIGSKDSNDNIRSIIEQPPLEKLPPMHYEGNFAGLKMLAFFYDLYFYLLALKRF